MASIGFQISVPHDRELMNHVTLQSIPPEWTQQQDLVAFYLKQNRLILSLPIDAYELTAVTLCRANPVVPVLMSHPRLFSIERLFLTCHALVFSVAHPVRRCQDQLSSWMLRCALMEVAASCKAPADVILSFQHAVAIALPNLMAPLSELCRIVCAHAENPIMLDISLNTSSLSELLSESLSLLKRACSAIPWREGNMVDCFTSSIISFVEQLDTNAISLCHPVTQHSWQYPRLDLLRQLSCVSDMWKLDEFPLSIPDTTTAPEVTSVDLEYHLHSLRTRLYCASPSDESQWVANAARLLSVLDYPAYARAIRHSSVSSRSPELSQVFRRA